jgi:hypothetical protein
MASARTASHGKPLLIAAQVAPLSLLLKIPSVSVAT